MTKIRVSVNPDLTPVKPASDVPWTSIELIVDTQILEDGHAFLIQKLPDGSWGVQKDGKFRLYTKVVEE